MSTFGRSLFAARIISGFQYPEGRNGHNAITGRTGGLPSSTRVGEERDAKARVNALFGSPESTVPVGEKEIAWRPSKHRQSMRVDRKVLIQIVGRLKEERDPNYAELYANFLEKLEGSHAEHLVLQLAQTGRHREQAGLGRFVQVRVPELNGSFGLPAVDASQYWLESFWFDFKSAARPEQLR